MTHILTEAAWWLLMTQINAGAWLIISGWILLHWVAFDMGRRLFP